MAKKIRNSRLRDLSYSEQFIRFSLTASNSFRASTRKILRYFVAKTNCIGGVTKRHAEVAQWTIAQSNSFAMSRCELLAKKFQ